MRFLKEVRTVLDNYQLKSGIYHFYRGEYKQAIELLGRALRPREHLSDYDAGIARYYLTQAHLSAAEEADADGELDRAVEQLQAAEAVHPNYPDILFRLARALETAGRLPEAIEKFRRTIELNPKYIEARTALAFALMGSDRADEASQEFQEFFKQTVAGIAQPFREG